MSHSNKAIVWFNEVGKKDLASVGGKGANLGELTNAQIPVPPGFIVTAQAYYDFIAKTGIAEQIRKLLSGINRQDSKQLQQIAEEIQQVIIQSDMPSDLIESVKDSLPQDGTRTGSGPFFGYRRRFAGCFICRSAEHFFKRSR